MPILPRRRSLFVKYAAYFAGLVSALLVVSGGLGGYFAYRQSITDLEALQRAQVSFAAREIANFVGRVEGALVAASNKMTWGGPADLEDLRVELIVLLRHQPAIFEVHALDTDGREHLALSRVIRDRSQSGNDWSRDPNFLGARNGGKHVGQVMLRDGTEPHLMLAVGRKPDGAVLVADVNLKFVGEVIARIQAEFAGVAYVVDGSGHLIAHPETSVMLGRNDFSRLPQVRRATGRDFEVGSLTGTSQSLQGAPVFASAVTIPRLGWTVIVEQPLAEALQPVYASVARSTALVFLGVVAAFAVSLVLARRMVRPIHEIEAGAREIGKGNLDHRIDVRTGDELESLGIELNRSAARLQEIHATQETRITERTQELALANEAKTRFIAAASHDLRQPIHALALFVGQLRGIPQSDEGRVLSGKIERSVEALQELLEALLDLSKLDVGAVDVRLRAFAIHDLLSRLVSEFTVTAESHGLALSLVPSSLWVRSDPVLLERILRNLVTNAILYTREGRILIGCRRRGEHVDVIVADTGIGIEAIHLPHVFREFYRAGPAQDGSTRGMGLGLAIVKRLALLLDHPIAIDSVLGKGTVVRLRVPQVAEEHVTAPQTMLVHGLDGARVLIVDDEASVRDAMQGLLAQWGCEAVVADSGDDALARTREWRPEVVLCDLSLADGEDGLAVLQRLLSVHDRDMACAFITGESAPERLAEVRARGYPIMFKPMKPANLRALVEHLVLSARAKPRRHFAVGPARTGLGAFDG